MLGIRVSEIQDNQLKYIEGYSWQTNEKTREKFEEQRDNNVGYGNGHICLDLIEIKGDIIDTITITKEQFMLLKPL